MAAGRIILGMTGATGMVYSVALLELLAEQEMAVDVVISDCGIMVLRV
jgi:3-polyprenyl-4-hydroxybenzoate decarboxylase